MRIRPEQDSDARLPFPLRFWGERDVNGTSPPFSYVYALPTSFWLLARSAAAFSAMCGGQSSEVRQSPSIPSLRYSVPSSVPFVAPGLRRRAIGGGW